MTSKPVSLLWIVIAYLACCAAGLAWLLYSDGHVLLHSFIADVIATVVIFAFSRVFKNSSFYDAYWSVIPPLFLLYWWFTRSNDIDTLRFVLVSIVVWYWALRLTWNWGKHWPGLHHEDWRYGMLKEKFPRAELLVDFFGIHFFPTVQVFLGMLPMYAAVALGSRPVNVLDYVALVIGVGAVTIQLLADRQLHRFIEQRKPGEIIDSGLWGWSRHPNYFGEIMVWVSLALFGLAAYPQGWWWQIIGAVAMLVMFLAASIPMMEKRSLERRPQYQHTIDRVSMLVPWPPKKR
ncbi:MAG TPA: DUF1295 domain-containing protein [Pseudomonadales bacterium]